LSHAAAKWRRQRRSAERNCKDMSTFRASQRPAPHQAAAERGLASQ
jgi:hypothetical protein